MTLKPRKSQGRWQSRYRVWAANGLPKLRSYAKVSVLAHLALEQALRHATAVTYIWFADSFIGD